MCAKKNKLSSLNIKMIYVKTGLKSGYWTCSGVSGTPNKKGIIKPAYAQMCWK